MKKRKLIRRLATCLLEQIGENMSLKEKIRGFEGGHGIENKDEKSGITTENNYLNIINLTQEERETYLSLIGKTSEQGENMLEKMIKEKMTTDKINVKKITSVAIDSKCPDKIIVEYIPEEQIPTV